MKLIYKKSFVKAYSKLSLRDRKKVDEALLLFMNDATDVNLRNHALHGKLHGKRAISAGLICGLYLPLKGNT